MKTIAMVVLATLCCVATALCQTETATILGRISDPTGAAIAGADVQVQNVLTGREVTTKTNSTGLYVVPALQPGTYRIIVSNPGFKQIVKPDVVLNVQADVSLNFTMTVGSVSETVTVHGGTPLVDTEDASVGTVVDNNFAQNMPLNGRSMQSLMQLTPGVTQAKTSYVSGGQFNASGQRSDANSFSVDGVSANVGVSQGSDSSPAATSAAGSLPAVTAGGGTNNLVSVDAVQEFKIQTSTFAPEFGRTPGAQVSLVTRSGTNNFHGTAFEYLRNGVLDAASWFVNYNKLPNPAIKQNDFGGVFGGPILKNRLFFFFSYEGLRLRQPQSETVIVPSMLARSKAVASIQPLLAAFPQPTSTTSNPLLGSFSGSYSNPSTLNATSIRVDYALTNKISIFGRYDHAPSSADSRGAFAFYTLSTIGDTISNLDTLTMGATATLKPNLVNEFRFNFSRATGGIVVAADNFGGAVIPSDSYLFQGYPGGNTKVDYVANFFLPDVTGFAVGNCGGHRQQQFQFVDKVAWTVSSHAIKAGFDYRRLTPRDDLFPYAPYAYIAGMAGALTGTAALVQLHSDEGLAVHPLVQNLSLFAQDTWKATSRLTLTYGVRWDYNPPPRDTSGHPLYTVVNLGDLPNAAYAPGGTPLWNATHDNFAPRVGIAYTLREAPGSELVLHGGAGIFYDLGNTTGTSSEWAPPYYQTKFLYNVPVPLIAADAAPAPFTLTPPYGTARGYEPDLKMPRTYEWNVSLEQSLGSNQSVSATYLGAAGRKLLADELLTPGLASEGLNPDFAGGILVTTNDAHSNYNALQLQYQRRVSHGLQVLASYSLAHALDNSSGVSQPLPWHTIYNPDWDYANANFDVRHSFSTAVTYNVPSPGKSALVRAIAGNWSLDSLLRVSSALPINVLTGADTWGVATYGVVGVTVQRPDLVPGVPLSLYGSQYPGGKAINPAAFQLPASGTQGDLRRNALRGFGAWEEDFAIRREFPIKERLKLQFRAEFFNIFNHPNFGDPGSQFTYTNSLANPFFGLSTTTLAQSFDSGAGAGSFNPLYNIGGPRSIQVALKLMF